MLIEFSVENFRSFKERMTLSMVANDSEELLHSNTASVGKKLRLLKSLAIYGANASGKSNLVKALEFMLSFIQNSSKNTQAGEGIYFDPFQLNPSCKEQPSSFEITFTIGENIYRYGFQINQKDVISEWLFMATGNDTEQSLFTREKNEFIINSDLLISKDIESLTRNNALFLSVLAQFNNQYSLNILHTLSEFSYLSEQKHDWSALNEYSKFLLMEKDELFLNLINRFNLGFEAIIHRDMNIFEYLKKTMHPTKPVNTQPRKKGFLEQIFYPEQKLKINEAALEELISEKARDLNSIFTVHKLIDDTNNIIGEAELSYVQSASEGTKTIFGLSGLLTHFLRNTGMIIYDELGTSLHPLLSRKIIELFNNSETNPNGAQLIFTTHDTNLLSRKLLRRDQIWFTEKMPHGATDLYSLADFEIDEKQSVDSTSYSDDYLMGKYGAIPYIGDVAALLGGRKHE